MLIFSANIDSSLDVYYRPEKINKDFTTAKVLSESENLFSELLIRFSLFCIRFFLLYFFNSSNLKEIPLAWHRFAQLLICDFEL